MRVLLDTHTFLWFTAGDERLPGSARGIIENQANEKFVSLASCWEIAIKHSLGRLELAIPLDKLLTEAIEGNGFVCLEIERPHLLQIAMLPSAHGDPFDRLLVAQAQICDLILVSKDKTLDSYGVSRIW